MSATGFDKIEIGVRQNPIIAWQELGEVIEIGVKWTWDLTPGTFSFSVPVEHYINSQITNLAEKAYQFRATRLGKVFTGRVMSRSVSGKPGRETITYHGLCNKVYLQSSYAWVNNLFPPEVQFGLTGKQDIRVGYPDPTMKSYVSSVFTRLGLPVYSAMPTKIPAAQVPDLSDFNSVNSVLNFIFGHTENVVAMMARFTQLDELFAPTVNRLEMGVTVDLWDGSGTPPNAFVADGVAALQSIFDINGSHFLDLSLLGRPINDGLWSDAPNRACYIFDTHEIRQRPDVQWRTDGAGGVQSYTMTETHPTATRVIVGGKAPSLVNDLIEIGANLAIAAIIAGLSLIPGLNFLGGLLVTVGDLFDDIFFAYQVFSDPALESKLGDDRLPEKFTDNTAAHTIDSYAIGKNGLKANAGGMQLDITALAGLPGGAGITFGEDDGGARRYSLGDRVGFWDRGNLTQKHVTAVAVTSKRGERAREQVTLGDEQRAKGAWTRLITGMQGFGATTRGIANST